MFTLKNDLLEIAIHPIGAELQKISSVKNNLEFMWDGNPEYWTDHAPNLFPIVGALKNGAFIYEDQAFTLPKHGFARHNQAFTLEDHSEHRLSLKLMASEETLQNYPFKFEFLVTFELQENEIKITYTVKNVDDKTIYFSVGGHPAFKCPVFSDEAYSDYTLQFEHPETAETYLINLSSGLLTSHSEAIFTAPKSIALHEHLFDRDALVFKDLKSKKVTLNSKKYGNILSVDFNDFPFLGIWAKPKAHFVCIEPWQGVADSENSTQILKNKEGIVTLDNGKTYSASYTIEIHKTHLA